MMNAELEPDLVSFSFFRSIPKLALKTYGNIRFLTAWQFGEARQTYKRSTPVLHVVTLTGVCLAVYTPSLPVLCGQILPGGEACVLALDGRDRLVACALLERSKAGAIREAFQKLTNAASKQVYGTEAKYGLEVELKDA